MIWVSVLIDSPVGSAVEIGLTENFVQTAAELRLRQNGVPITNSTSGPYLRVGVIILPTQSGEQTRGYAYLVSVELYEVVMSIRTRAVEVVITWATSILGVGPPDSARNDIRELVVEYIDQFSNAYLTANPIVR